MLDGRIDTQGTVKDLRARGVLDDITHEEKAEAAKEEQAVEAAEKGANAEVDADAEPEDAKPVEKAKKPRKLIEDEKREEGSVKWSIYNTYLKASCVIPPQHVLLTTHGSMQIILDVGDLALSDCVDSGTRFCLRLLFINTQISSGSRSLGKDLDQGIAFRSSNVVAVC